MESQHPHRLRTLDVLSAPITDMESQRRGLAQELERALEALQTPE